LQADCLLKILDKEVAPTDAERDTLVNSELEKMDANRRQDLSLHFVFRTNLLPNIKEQLCDKIQQNHPQYTRARIEKANLVFTNSNLNIDERFKQGMLILMGLGNHKDALELKRNWLTQYCETFMGTTLPTYIDPQNEPQLIELITNVQEKEKEKLSKTSSL
jgi:hypothetical protein